MVRVHYAYVRIILVKDGKSRNTICNVRGVLKPAFEMEVRDNWI